MLNYNIIGNIKDYKISLKSLNLQNNFKQFPNQLKVGISRKFLNHKEEENSLSVPCCLDIIGLINYEKANEILESNDENVLFKINLIYEVDLMLNKNFNDVSKISNDINEYSYFLLEPKLNNIVASLGNEIGFPNLTLPKKLTKNADNN